ncbi:MAG: hypothetical protein JRC86_13060 [Deltaproteobacteria bacterium]|nr:hypothetical protein [Deltaproteobacteria bacterium]
MDEESNILVILPDPTIEKIPLEDIQIDTSMNPRNVADYDITSMISTLVTSGSLNGLVAVHRNGNGIHVAQGFRRMTAIRKMLDAASDKEMFLKQWGMIPCAVYENLDQQQLTHLIQDHGAQLAIDKVGTYQSYRDGIFSGFSGVDMVSRLWLKFRDLFKTSDEKKRKTTEDLENATTESDRRNIRRDAVAEHKNQFDHNIGLRRAGVTIVETEYIKKLSGLATKIQISKLILGRLRKEAEKDCEEHRDPMKAGSCFKKYWNQLLKEKKEADEKKKNKEPRKSNTPLNQAEIDDLVRLSLDNPLAHSLAQYFQGDRSQLPVALELMQRMLDTRDIPTVIKPEWKELRKTTDGEVAGNRIAELINTAIKDKREEESEPEVEDN